MFDLTAANIAGKYPGKAGLAMMLHMVFKVMTLMSQHIKYFDWIMRQSGVITSMFSDAKGKSCNQIFSAIS